MKKLFLLFLVLILNVNLCWAATKISRSQIKEYKKDMTQVLNSILDDKNMEGLTYREYFTKVYDDELNWYENVFIPDKNNMKRNYEFNMGINSKLGKINDVVITQWYEYFKPVIIKYNLEICSNCDYNQYIIKYYLKKHRIPRTEELIKLKEDSRIYVISICQVRDKILGYSQEYETQKISNFYNKSIVPILNKHNPLNIMMYLTQVRNFDKSQLYYGNPKVIQILNGGFLADFDSFAPSYYNTVIFVKAQDAYKLKYGDYFDPYLPLKFTGQYYTYRTLSGEKRTVPIFIIALSSNKNINIPEMADKFYFIEKPNWKDTIKNYSLDSLYVINKRRIFDNKDRSPYFKYR